MKRARAQHAVLMQGVCILVTQGFEGHSRLEVGDPVASEAKLLGNYDVAKLLVVHGRILAMTGVAIVGIDHQPDGAWAAVRMARLPGEPVAYGLDGSGSLVVQARGSDALSPEERWWPTRVEGHHVPQSQQPLFALRLDDAVGRLEGLGVAR